MKVIDLLDPAPYTRLTTEIAIQNLASRWGADYQGYSMDCLRAGRYGADSSSDILIFFHAAILKIANVTTAQVKQRYPQARIIGFGTDTAYYERGGRHDASQGLLCDFERRTEFYSPYDCDLFLDTLDEIVDAYRARGIQSDYWMWTASETIIEDLLSRSRQPKTYDFIALFDLNCSGRDYRKRLLNHLASAGKSVFGTGRVGYDLGGLHAAYSASRFVLGTTSPSWTVGIRTMKGFRDWIGPACGSVLIYDDHPDIRKKYTACPLYGYEDFPSILSLIESLDYEKTLEQQQQWIAENTLEKQLERLLVKYAII